MRRSPWPFLTARSDLVRPVVATSVNLLSAVCYLLFCPGPLSSGVFTRPEILLRIEGAFDLALSLIFFEAIQGNWLLFILLLLVPDLAMLGYLGGARMGTVCYNLAQTLAGPFLIVAYAYLMKSLWLLPYALIWTAHIGLDRMLGFGLKYPTRFGDTHLGRMTDEK